MFSSYLSNTSFWICLFSVVSAQLLKVITNLVVERKVNWEKGLGTGGMPSSHASMVMTIVTLVFFLEGPDSLFFTAVSVFGAIVLWDACGVRQAAGKHAEILNELINEFRHLFEPKEFSQALKTALGHTGLQVIAGMIYGTLVGYFAIRIFY